jgi:hypothetical protein
MIPKDSPTFRAPIEVEEIPRDPSFDSIDTELDVKHGFAALSVLVDFCAATLGTAYRRRPRKDFVCAELGPPRFVSFLCDFPEPLTRSNQDSFPLVIPISGLVNRLKFGDLKLHLLKLEE